MVGVLHVTEYIRMRYGQRGLQVHRGTSPAIVRHHCRRQLEMPEMCGDLLYTRYEYGSSNQRWLSLVGYPKLFVRSRKAAEFGYRNLCSLDLRVVQWPWTGITYKSQEENLESQLSLPYMLQQLQRRCVNWRGAASVLF